jgi:serpin B
MGNKRNKRLWSVIAALALALSVAVGWGCGSEGPATIDVIQSNVPRETVDDVSDHDLKQLVAGNSAFAIDLFQAARGGTPRNLILSPYSVSCAMAMVFAGAQGKTQSQIADTLHFSLEGRTLHPTFNRLQLDLAERPAQAQAAARGSDAGKELLRLQTAQGLFGSPTIDWGQQFLDLLSADYGAAMQTVDFTKTEQARALVNRWVAERTGDRIKEALPPGSVNPKGLPSELVLVDALYLNACWAYPFPSSGPGDFHLLDGTTISADTMVQAMPFPSAEGPGWKAVELPYKGDKLSFVIVLPAEGQFETFAAGLTMDMLESIIAALDEDASQPSELVLSVPKFGFGSAFTLEKPLQILGVTSAFQPGEADFSPMGAAHGGVWIDEIYHGATIAVDERGTEASAATVVMMVAGIAEGKMTVDRPFIFMIRDRDTGTILFLGQMVDPSSTDG